MSSARSTSYQKNPNPQGKGVVPVLRDWNTMVPAVLGPKLAPDFLRDYCVSSLVLAASFRFKPVLGKTYYLYATNDGWNLSMIAPQEWTSRKRGEFLARCHLRPDMTWEMDTDDLAEEPEALQKARNFVRGFVDTLVEQESIGAHLPYFVTALPYYQRMLATALSASLKRTMPSRAVDMKLLLQEQRGQLLLG